MHINTHTHIYIYVYIYITKHISLWTVQLYEAELTPVLTNIRLAFAANRAPCPTPSVASNSRPILGRPYRSTQYRSRNQYSTRATSLLPVTYTQYR